MLDEVGERLEGAGPIQRTSTWPWERGTLSGFATALAAPIALFLLTRLLGRFV
jgi:hypothetical protein